MQVLTERLRTLIAVAGYGSREPVIAGVQGRGRPPVSERPSRRRPSSWR
jgi:hypothetical protein